MHQHEFEEKAYQDYTTFLEDSRDWRLQVDKMRNYYYGQQMSQTMSDIYASRGWTQVTLNKIRPIVKNKVSRMVAGKPKGKVFGYSAVDMPTAFALNEFLDYHYYSSEGQIQFEDAALAQLRDGISYLVVYRDWMADYGRGELKFAFHPYEDVFTRKSARRWDFSDAGRIIVSVLVDKSDVAFRLHEWVKDVDLDQFLHPMDIPKFEGRRRDGKFDVIGIPNDFSGENRYIREFDVYDLVQRKILAVHYIPTNTIIPVDDDYKPNDVENQMIKDGIIRFDEFLVPRVQYTKFIGNGTNSIRIGEQEILPIEFFPVVPIHNERTGNACSLGEVHFFYGSQEMLNQSAALMVMHAALASLFKVIVDTRIYKGDLEDLKSQWSAVGAIIGVESDPDTGKMPIEVVRPEPINQAFWTMTQYFGAELEYQAMASPLNWGMPTKHAPDTLPPLMALNEWADNSLRLHLNHFEIAIERLYTVLLQWSKEFYGYKTFPVFRESGEFENFVNSKIPLDTGFKDATGNPIMSYNNIRELRTRYRIQLGSTKPSPTHEYVTIFSEMAKQYPVLLKFVVKYLDINPEDKAEILQALDITSQQAVKIEQLTSHLQAISKAMQNVMAENLELRQKHKVEQVAHRAEKAAIKEQAKIKEQLIDIQRQQLE